MCEIVVKVPERAMDSVFDYMKRIRGVAIEVTRIKKKIGHLQANQMPYCMVWAFPEAPVFTK